MGWRLISLPDMWRHQIRVLGNPWLIVSYFQFCFFSQTDSIFAKFSNYEGKLWGMDQLWWLFPSTIWGRIFCQIHCEWSFPLCCEFSLKGNFKAAIFLRHKVVEGVTSNEIDGILEIDLEEAIVFEDFYIWSGRESSKEYICLKGWRPNVFFTPKTIFNPPLRWLLFFSKFLLKVAYFHLRQYMRSPCIFWRCPWLGARSWVRWSEW